ncbi:MAG: ADP-ribosylglycohydrolase family protein [Naasia sp.]
MSTSTPSSPGAQERARGCLIALAVGDAMGAPTEGMTRRAVAEQFGRITDFTDDTSTGTDDTEYAVMTARAVITHGRDLTADHVAADWLAALEQQKDGYAGAGFSEMGALAALRQGIRPPHSGRRCAESWSDGAAMRAAPIGIFHAGDPLAAAELAEREASVSHSRDGIDGARVIAAAVSVAMTGAPVPEIVAAGLVAVDPDSWTARTLARALDIAHGRDGGRDEGHGGIDADDTEAREQRLYDEIGIVGYPWADSAPEAVALTMAAVVLADGDPVRAIGIGVNMGRDSDTIAAMAGAICGASAGIGALPSAWTERVRLVHGVCVTATRGADLLVVADALMAVRA